MPEHDSAQAQQFVAWRERIDAALTDVLPAPTVAPQRLHSAMRHAVLLGGKRIRPLLVYATGAAIGLDPTSLDQPAIAVELMHTYSLVHDDLPAMDDDALRRGRATVHVAYDEATAILAGDALQTLAFAQLAAAPYTPAQNLAMLAELALAAGSAGMCGGQALDMDATGPAATTIDLQRLEQLHALKTGALLRACVRMAAIAGSAQALQRTHLETFADALGLAFQIRDDLLDVEGDSATLGKTAGKDAAQAKATFPSLIGIEASRARLRDLASILRDALGHFDDQANSLRALAQWVVERDR